MVLIVGLGNPGARYERTRHNAGFLALDEIARRHAGGMVPKARFNSVMLEAALGAEKVVLMKPTTFMNRSGLAVGEAVRFYKIDPAAGLLVIVDEVALPVGHLRVRQSGGAGGHNGLADIDRALSGSPYPRVRIGVGAVPEGWIMADWVLSRFAEEEAGVVGLSAREAADAAECVVKEGILAAMNRFNKKVTKEETTGRDGDPGPKDQNGAMQI